MLSFIPRPVVMARLRAELQAVRERGRGRMVAVRGRRQMGKSTVVESFVEHCETPYVFATGLYRQPAQEQLIFAARTGRRLERRRERRMTLSYPISDRMGWRNPGRAGTMGRR